MKDLIVRPIQRIPRYELLIQVNLPIQMNLQVNLTTEMNLQVNLPIEMNLQVNLTIEKTMKTTDSNLCKKILNKTMKNVKNDVKYQ